jgi:hypothetical protein
VLTALSLGAPAVVLGAVLAAQGDIPDWARYGILGVLFLAVCTGQLIVPAYLWKGEKARGDAAEDRERALLTGMAQTATDALRENTATLARLGERISDLAAVRREAR